MLIANPEMRKKFPSRLEGNRNEFLCISKQRREAKSAINKVVFLLFAFSNIFPSIAFACLLFLFHYLCLFIHLSLTHHYNCSRKLMMAINCKVIHKDEQMIAFYLSSTTLSSTFSFERQKPLIHPPGQFCLNISNRA